MSVADRIGDGVGEGFAHAEGLYGGQAVVQDIGVGTIGVEGKGPVGSGRAALGDERNGVVSIRVLRRRQSSRCGDLRIFGDGGGSGCNGRRVVGAVNGDGERVGSRCAVVVRDGVGEGVGKRFPDAEPLDRGRGVVQYIGIGAVGPQGQGTVVPQRAVLGYEGDGIPPVGIAGRWQGSGGCELYVLSDGGCRCGDGGCVVGAVDGNSQGVGGGSPVVVAHRVGERFGQAVSRSKGAHGGQVVVEVVGPCAVRMQRKGAVGPRRTVLGQEGHHVVRVRIMGRGQYAADAARDACGPGV